MVKVMKNTEQHFKTSEVWYQDQENADMWHGRHGVIINTAALNEREFYFDIIRITQHPSYSKERYTRAYA
jgi:hypothetical protein